MRLLIALALVVLAASSAGGCVRHIDLLPPDAAIDAPPHPDAPIDGALDASPDAPIDAM